MGSSKRLFVVVTVVPLLAGLLAAYWINFHAPAIGFFHDDGIYVVAAKALAEGKGYRVVSLPSEIFETKYPPVYPLLLAGVWKLDPHFPQNVPWLKLVPLSSAFCWLVVSFFLLRKKSGSSPLAFGTILLTAAAPWVVFLSASLLSEMTFAALATASLLVLLDLEKEPRPAVWKVIAAAVLSAATVLTRAAGFPLIIAGFGIFCFRRKFRAAFLFLMLGGILLVPWLWWANSHRDAVQSPYKYYGNYSGWSAVLNFTWAQKDLVIERNIIFSFVSPALALGIDIPRGNNPALQLQRAERADNVAQRPSVRPLAVLISIYTLVVGTFVFVGLAMDLRRNVSTLNVFLLLYFLVVVTWAWPPLRFFIPFLPILLFYGYTVLKRCLRDLPSVRNVSAVAVGIVLLLVAPFTVLALIAQARETQQTKVANLEGLQFKDWNSILPLLDWISRNTAHDAVVMSSLDPVVYLYTGRNAALGFDPNPVELTYRTKPHDALGSPSEIVDHMLKEKIDYIVRIRDANAGMYVGRSLGEFVDQLVRNHPETVQLEMVGPDPSCSIYHVDRQKLASAFGSVLSSGPMKIGQNQGTDYPALAVSAIRRRRGARAHVLNERQRELGIGSSGRGIAFGLLPDVADGHKHN